MQLLREYLPTEDGGGLVRDMEAACHAYACTQMHYIDLVLKCAKNCYNNPENAHAAMCLAEDEELTRGSILELLREREKARRRAFQRMLQDKVDRIDETKEYKSSLRCRRCKSTDVSWDIKQTRSADEASTAFCVCASCGNRWTIK